MRPNRNPSIIVVALLLQFVMSGCAILFPGSRPSDPIDALCFDIRNVLSDSIFVAARPSIKVISLDRKETLFERDSKLLTRPASNMKLVTSSSALGVLGKDYKLRTVVLADSATDGIVHGNLYLKGYGDPDLTTADLDSLAALVQSAGVRSIDGGISADVSFFDDLSWGYGWNWDDEPYSYAPFLTPLCVNSNCVSVTVEPGDSAGQPVKVTLDPPTSYLTLLNKGTTVSDTALRRLEVTRLFREHLNTILVDGEMKTSARAVHRTISVWKPELYAATLFSEALKKRGIAVTVEPSATPAPQGARELAALSISLDSAIVFMNKESDNLSAEVLLKTLGATSGSPGSAQGGIYTAHRFLSSFGIDSTKINLADGSGLSFYDLLTAEMLCQLLEGMHSRTDLFPSLYRSLPIAGVDGTLRNRMKKTPAEGNLRAKTGTISGVSSLSGYVTTLDGEMLAFSMTMQNFILPTRLVTRAQDRIGALLAGFSRTGRSAPTLP